MRRRDIIRAVTTALVLFVFTMLAAAGVIGIVILRAQRAHAQTASCKRVELPVVVNLDDVRHAHLIAHERAAIEKGQPRTVTLERDNAAGRRTQDLRGIPTRTGFDRDEWPPAFTEEAGLHSDGTRADVEYVASSENRSGGATMGAALRSFCDGQRFVVEAGLP